MDGLTPCNNMEDNVNKKYTFSSKGNEMLNHTVGTPNTSPTRILIIILLILAAYSLLFQQGTHLQPKAAFQKGVCDFYEI